MRTRQTKCTWYLSESHSQHSSLVVCALRRRHPDVCDTWGRTRSQEEKSGGETVKLSSIYIFVRSDHKKIDSRTWDSFIASSTMGKRKRCRPPAHRHAIQRKRLNGTIMNYTSGGPTTGYSSCPLQSSVVTDGRPTSPPALLFTNRSYC